MDQHNICLHFRYLSNFRFLVAVSYFRALCFLSTTIKVAYFYHRLSLGIGSFF